MDEDRRMLYEEIQRLKRPLLQGMRAQLSTLGRTVHHADLVNVCKNVITPLVEEPPTANRRMLNYSGRALEMDRIGDYNQPRLLTIKSSYKWCKELGLTFKSFLKEFFNILMLLALVFFAAYVLILICDHYAPYNPNRFTLPNIFLMFYEYFFK